MNIIWNKNSFWDSLRVDPSLHSLFALATNSLTLLILITCLSLVSVAIISLNEQGIVSIKNDIWWVGYSQETASSYTSSAIHFFAGTCLSSFRSLASLLLLSDVQSDFFWLVAGSRRSFWNLIIHVPSFLLWEIGLYVSYFYYDIMLPKEKRPSLWVRVGIYGEWCEWAALV